jgi:hypothetical protein
VCWGYGWRKKRVLCSWSDGEMGSLYVPDEVRRVGEIEGRPRSLPFIE